jgi:DNA invertase Pin-like site-specific DNA recombinase
MSRKRKADLAISRTIERLKGMGAPVKARAYLRVSHAKGIKLRNMVSHDMQMAAARRYCEYHGFELDEESSWRNADLDESAFDRKWTDRPGILGHFRDAERGEFNVLVFFKISRMARDVYEGLAMINAFEEAGTSFHFVEENLDGSSPQGRMMRTVMLAFAEMQSEEQSAFQRAAHRERAVKGRASGGSPPGWIRRSPDGKHETIPEMVGVVRRMIELRWEGNSYVRIAAALNAEGRLTLRGAFWDPSRIALYLSHSYLRTMMGYAYFHRGKGDTISFLAYPPILTEEEYARTLEVKKRFGTPSTRGDGGYAWDAQRAALDDARDALMGMLTCPTCGARSSGHGKGKGKVRPKRMGSGRHYRCSRRRKVRPDDPHRGTPYTIDACIAENAALRVLRACVGKQEYAFPAPEPETIRVDYGARIKRAERRISTSTELLAAGRISQAQYDRMYGEATAELDRLQAQAQAEPTPEVDPMVQERRGMKALLEFIMASMVGPIYCRADFDRRQNSKGRFKDPEVSDTNGYRLNARGYLYLTLKEPLRNGPIGYLAPIYNVQYKGPRMVFPIFEEIERDGPWFVRPEAWKGIVVPD